mmetsp:Transcript_22564/g.67677  ORF Transcript_22564/g.67677 Transcript_22564/m.67677 type:complete len:479 (+) Transcript_22564:180-1616(+)
MWGNCRRAVAAEAASLQGRGKGFCPGRSVFKRSANKDRRHRWRDDDLSFSSPERKAQLRRATRAEAEEALDDRSEEEPPCCEPAPCEIGGVRDAPEDFLDDSMLPPVYDEVFGDAWEHDLSEGAFEEEWDLDLRHETCSTCESTAAAPEDDVRAEPRPAKVVSGVPCRAPLTPWQLAVRRARMARRRHRGSLLSEEAAPDEPAVAEGRARSIPPQPSYKGEHRALVEELEQFQASIPFDVKADLRSPFEQFRWQFLKQHGATFCPRLSACNGPFSLRAAPLNPAVGRAFMKACHGELEGKLLAAYHGTNENNLSSIYATGLEIPGKGNALRVVNGSVHGLGVYTAEVNNPSLSLGYARGVHRRLLVCGVFDCDDPAEVLHTGSALVFYNARRVAPLWEATFTQAAGTQPPPLPPPAPRAPVVKRRVLPAPGPQCRRAPKKRREAAAARLTGVAAFLARRAAQRRRSTLNLRGSRPARR